MEWVETTGRTVAEALEVALDELGVDEHDAEVVIVEEPKSGIFGFGRADARVRARVRPSTPRPKRPQRPRRSRDRNRPEQDGRPAVSPDRPGPRKKGAPRADGGEPGARDGVTTPSPNGDEPSGASRRRRRGGRGRGSGSGGAASAATAGVLNEEDEMSVEEQAAAVETFVRGVVERFGLQGSTTSSIEEGNVRVDVAGDDLGLLIGPRGATLDALQELARTVVQRRGEEHGARVTVDVASFRAKRAAALEAFVRRIAAEVIESGVAEALEPMSAADRKIVHDAMNGVDGVETTSEGVEPRRYVVIRPASTPAPSDAADLVSE